MDKDHRPEDYPRLTLGDNFASDLDMTTQRDTSQCDKLDMTIQRDTSQCDKVLCHV